MLFKRIPEPAPIPEVPAEETQLRLSQSLVKNIEEETMCPRFYQEYYLLRLHKLVATQAQRIGQYFEWLALNNKPKDGDIVLPELSGRGKKPVDMVRIEEQAQQVITLLERYDMHVVIPEGHDCPSIHLQLPLPEYPEIMFEGTFDFIAESHFEDAYTITDLKATKTLHSTYGPNGKAGWGDFFNMDHLQAYSYLWLARQRFPNRSWRFRYAVFSYEARKDYQIFEVDMTSLELQETLQRINLAAAKLTEWRNGGFEPKGHPDCCTRCVHRTTCPASRLVKPITVFKKY